jgi:hypothetical protein
VISKGVLDLHFYIIYKQNNVTKIGKRRYIFIE